MTPVPSPETRKPIASWSRRRFLGLGAVGMGGLGAAALWRSPQARSASVRVPPPGRDYRPPKDLSFDPMAILRDFDYGRIKKEKGRTIREFELTAQTTIFPLNRTISYVSWNLNGRVPGPTLRARAGDRIRVIFHNQGGHLHSLHFHGIHPAAMDGLEPVFHGDTFIYEFDAEPYGVHPYHCHIAPVARHVSKGLYGLLIIDPPQDRPPADEMVLVMGNYDLQDPETKTGGDLRQIYTFNGIPNFYHDHPIAIYQHQRIRVYVLNMIESDSAVTFHLHANLFQVYPTGRSLKPAGETDVITMGTAERHILEFAYPFPGHYMFHPHQDAIAENGCMGMFEVLPS